MSNNQMAYQYLLNYLCDNNDKQKLEQMLNALLTQKEQQELANRVLIFAMLQQNKTQREISETLGVGIATVSRGAKAFQKHHIHELSPDLSKDLPFLVD